MYILCSNCGDSYTSNLSTYVDIQSEHTVDKIRTGLFVCVQLLIPASVMTKETVSLLAMCLGQHRYSDSQRTL